MKIKILKEDLLNGLQTVQSVVSVKTTLPILMNILLKTSDKERIKLTATDLDSGISCLVKCEVLEEGSITIPAKKALDIVKELPDQPITITAKKNNMVTIECGRSFFKIIGLPETEFPELPSFKDCESIKIPQQLFKEMINMTCFAVSRDEARYILNGIYLIIDNDIRMVATDGRRLACITRDFPQQKPETQKKVVIPGKTVNELIRTLTETGEVEILFSNNQIIFQLQDTVIISRLIEGEYPDYTQVIPKEVDNKINIDKEDFLSATRRAGLLTSKSSQAVSINMSKNKMIISKNSPELGEVKEEIDVKYPGNELNIGFNPSYITDVLKNIKEENITLELISPEKPGVIRTKDRYVYVVLPMQIN